MPWSKTGGTQYHAQIGLSDNGRPIKGLIDCYVVWLASMIYGIHGSLVKRNVRSLVPCCGQDGYRAQVPQNPIDSYRYISDYSPKTS